MVEIVANKCLIFFFLLCVKISLFVFPVWLPLDTCLALTANFSKRFLATVVRGRSSPLWKGPWRKRTGRALCSSWPSASRCWTCPRRCGRPTSTSRSVGRWIDRCIDDFWNRIGVQDEREWGLITLGRYSSVFTVGMRQNGSKWPQ